MRRRRNACSSVDVQRWPVATAAKQRRTKSRESNVIRRQARANFLSTVFIATLVLLPGRAVAQASLPVTQVASGFEFTCVLSTQGGVSCFGQNNSGQLGDSSVLDRHAPVGVSGLGAGVVAIGAGQSHACALTTTGGVKCWGANYAGQLGDNTATRQLTPVDVFGLTSGVAAIAVGPLHTCALTVGGGMKCWGSGIAVGDGTNSQRNAPVDVLGLTSGVVAISAGGFVSCALTEGGGMKCWGGNNEGELGDGSTAPRPVPGDVSGLLAGVSAIAVGGSHVCALTTGGGMKCWGRNVDGAVGDNTTFQRLTPVDVLGLTSGVTAITAGAGQTCALTSGANMKCWGSNTSGQLGNGDSSGTPQLAPVDVVRLGNLVAAISAGGNHTCARTAGGNVACWGDGYYGQLGDGTGASGPLPVGVSGFSTNGVAQLGLGWSHTCALTNAGGVKCWGFNTDGELGNNSIAQSLVPVDVTGLTSGVSSIGAWKFHSCAVTASGSVKCWGQNTSGSLGDGTQTDRHAPTDVFGLTSGFSTLSLGSNHSCALSSVGSTVCWGGNSLGVLGDGTYNQQLFPVSVHQPVNLNYLSISAGDSVSCAVAFGGFMQCWGANNAGQLGGGVINTPTKTNVPGNVLGLPDILAMDSGGDHTCGLTLGSRGLKCWGANAAGQLGDGTLLSRPSPVDVAGLTSGVIAISSGTVHTCAVTSAGGVKCWGDNFYHQLGDGSSAAQPLPVDVVGLASGIAGIEAGHDHTCALTTAGGVKCWGQNLNGQLGDNSTTNRPTPVVAQIGGQSISFVPPVHLAPGVPVILSATASSGLAVTFDTWTPGTCSITGSTVTASSVGLCGIRASQAGNGNISAAPQVLRQVPVSLTPGMVSAVSRRVHGVAGAFDLPLSLSAPATVNHNPTTEPRQGPAQTVVMTFDRAIIAATATVTEGTATAAVPTFGGNDVVIGLTGVTDKQYVTISLTNVASTDGGTGGSGSVRIGFLTGDVNGSRVVSLADLGLVNAQLSQPISGANYLKDVNASGTLTLADKGITNANLTKSLPAP
jgi:alpha-tubulin suppressor-like RCC1 family protein